MNEAANGVSSLKVKRDNEPTKQWKRAGETDDRQLGRFPEKKRNKRTSCSPRKRTCVYVPCKTREKKKLTAYLRPSAHAGNPCPRLGLVSQRFAAGERDGWGKRDKSPRPALQKNLFVRSTRHTYRIRTRRRGRCGVCLQYSPFVKPHLTRKGFTLGEQGVMAESHTSLHHEAHQ